jgi:CheY-like chemotaxis protein
VQEGFDGQTEIVLTEVTLDRLDVEDEIRAVSALVALRNDAIELDLPGDFDGSAGVNLDDFFLFADAFGTQDARFDLNGDRSVNFPDIVISDLEMPEMGGIELMTKAHELAPNLAVVILSVVGDAASSSLAFQHGAYGYLQKPCRVEALIEGIRRLQDSTRRSTVHEVRSLI